MRPTLALLLATAPLDPGSDPAGFFAQVSNAIGARKAGLRMSLGDALASLAFWPLQSLAFAVAVRQLIVSPYHWDKTPHAPSVSAPLDAEALDERGRWSVSPAA